MELLALNEGLKLVEQNKFLSIEINIDSTKVISMLQNGNLLYDVIIDECRLRLMRLGAIIVQHYYREQNQVEDLLAKEGVTNTVSDDPTSFAVSPMFAWKAV